ncbi:NUDIX hydrolase [Candidatus Woesearchaeota archaeon]|nr:NUDIX hydrolase [Candidatus Woesearchaeota archaeon]
MKIPNTASCVFNGVIFDVYQWKQKMFDGSYATFEALKRPNTIQIIATTAAGKEIKGRNGKKSGRKSERICLLQEEQPTKSVFYGLPGGRQEKNETPLGCAKRELLEETGLASDDWQLLKTYEPFHKLEWFVYVFTARNCKKVAGQKLDAGEKIKVTWVSFDKFISLLIGKKFWGRELAADILRAKLTKNGLVPFKKRIFCCK